MPLPPLSFAVLDTETSGLTPRTHSVIEYADIRMKGEEEIDRFEELFSIEEAIPPHVEVLTRIRPAMLAGKETIATRRETILQRLSSVDLLVGQNLGFDLAMLKGEGIDLTDRPWVDTSMLASLVYPELASYSLPYMSSVLSLDHAPAHRALGDVRATLELLGRITERLLQLPSDQMEEAKALMKRTGGGYALFFYALPATNHTTPAPWMQARARRSIAPSDGTVTLTPPAKGSVTLLVESLHPETLQDILNASAADTKTCEWIAVKNLEHTLKHLHVPGSVRVLHPPSLLLNPAAPARLSSQKILLPEEATLLLKIQWFHPRTRFELPLHGGEKEIWNGRLACAAESPAYTEQFSIPACSYLLDHWQLLSILRDPLHPARALLTPATHVIIDDASMLEDTATRAYGHVLCIDDLRAAAQGDDALLRLTDLLALWAEKTRATEDQHFLTSSDYDQPETNALRHLVAEQQARTDLSARTQEQLQTIMALLQPALLEDHIVWMERTMDGRITLHAAPRHIDTLLRHDLFERFPTTLIVPPCAADALPEVIPQNFPIHSVSGVLRPAVIAASFPEPQSMMDYLKDPPDGKTILLAGSKRLIEQAFIAHTELLETRGVTLICQGMSGGQGRMEAEFLTASAPALLIVTPYLYEGMDLPEDSADRLVIESIPFDYLGHPVIGRRKDRYANGFNEYFLPRAECRLFRLLRAFCRHRTEGGSVIVLDRRLREKQYGKRLMAFLGSFSGNQTMENQKPAFNHAPQKIKRKTKNPFDKLMAGKERKTPPPSPQQSLPL